MNKLFTVQKGESLNAARNAAVVLVVVVPVLRAAF